MIKPVKLVYFLLFTLYSGGILAQKIDVKLDYTITYLLHKSNDTIKISVGEHGKYLYSDSKVIVNQVRQYFNSVPAIINNDSTDIKLLLNTAETEMLFFLKSDKTGVLMNLFIPDIMPSEEITADNVAMLTSDSRSEKIDLMGKSYPLYDLYQEGESDDKIILAFDEDYDLDYQANFSNLFRIILKSNTTFNIPNGIFVYIKDKNNQEVLRAIDVSKDSRTIAVDMNFHIK